MWRFKLVFALALARHVSAGCEHGYTCELCKVATPEAGGAECVWCDDNPFAPICADDIISSGFCEVPFPEGLDGTLYTPPDTCPSYPLRCNDFGANCTSCLIDAANAGFDCEWCVGEGPLGIIQLCLPQATSICSLVSGTAFPACPADQCEASLLICSTLPDDGQIYVDSGIGVDNDCCCGTADAPCLTISCGLCIAGYLDEPMVVNLRDGEFNDTDIVFPESTGSVTIRSVNGPAATILDCNQTGSGFTMNNLRDASIALEGFTIRNCISAAGGGAVRMVNADVTLRNMRFERNTALQIPLGGVPVLQGPGIYGGAMYGERSSPLIEDCVFLENYCVAPCFGAGAFFHSSSPRIIRTTFEANTCTGPEDVKGCALSIQGLLKDVIFIDDSIFRDNVLDVTDGGLAAGVAAAFDALSGVVVRNCLVENNRGHSDDEDCTGGGFFCNAVMAILDGCTFRGNVCNGTFTSGGGVALKNLAVAFGLAPEVKNCVFEDNVGIGFENEVLEASISNNGNVGGGVYLLSPLGSQVPVRNCTFRRNLVTTDGIATVDGGGFGTLFARPLTEDCIFESNSVYSGKGFARGGAVSLRGAIAPDLTRLSRCTFNDNVADGNSLLELTTQMSGGGAVAVELGHPTISACTFDGNTATDSGSLKPPLGGGAITFHSNFYGTVFPVVKDCIIRNGLVSGSDQCFGGGIAVSYPFSVIIKNTSITNNVVDCVNSYGGGIAINAAGITLEDTVLSYNTAVGALGLGAGMAAINLDGSPLPIAMDNVEFTHNLIDSEATDAGGCLGGGLALLSMSGELKSVKIEHNEVQSTGGNACVGAGMAVVNVPGLKLINSIITKNTGEGPESILGGGGTGLTLGTTDITLLQTRICGNLPISDSSVRCLSSPCVVYGNSGYFADYSADALGRAPDNECAFTGDCLSTCSGNGVCNVSICSCDEGFFGAQCNQECNGGSTPPCSGHGDCVDGISGDGTCSCFPGYSGSGCERPCPNNCSYAEGQGTCDYGATASGNCTCNPGFYKLNCNSSCPGLLVSRNGEVTPCQTNGVCDDGTDGNGECTCFENFAPPDCGDCLPNLFGRFCDKECPGKNCSSHGTCNDGRSGDGKCTCDEGYYGLGCSKECPGGADNACFGHGTCDAGAGGTGLCVCSGGYNDAVGCERCVNFFGPNCSRACPTTNDVVCGGEGRGSCDAGEDGSGLCVCKPGAFGAECTLTCPGFVAGGAAAEICGGHGSCGDGQSGGGACLCEDGFSGDGCQINDAEVNSNIGAAVAVGILVPCFILAIAGVAFYLWYTQKSCFKVYINEDGATVKAVKGNDGQMTTYVNTLLNKRNTRLLGSGGAADVYKAKLDTGEWVAIKKLKTRNPKEEAEFHSEVNILSSFVASDSHPNVIKLLFFCENPPVIAMELCEGGSLGEILAKNSSVLDNNHKIEIGQDTASGMAFLHENKVAHLDLKPDNILLIAPPKKGKRCEVKITDFGISQSTKQNTQGIEISGTIHYMSPERFGSDPWRPFPADVYSFGIYLWAVWVEERPYAQTDVHTMQELLMDGGEVERPPLPTDCLPMYQQLMALCWAEDPLERPSMQECIEILNNLEGNRDINDFITEKEDTMSLRSIRMSTAEPNLNSIASTNMDSTSSFANLNSQKIEPPTAPAKPPKRAKTNVLPDDIMDVVREAKENLSEAVSDLSINIFDSDSILANVQSAGKAARTITDELDTYAMDNNKPVIRKLSTHINELAKKMVAAARPVVQDASNIEAGDTLVKAAKALEEQVRITIQKLR